MLRIHFNVSAAAFFLSGVPEILVLRRRSHFEQQKIASAALIASDDD
jgi:hypothetical protein